MHKAEKAHKFIDCWIGTRLQQLRLQGGFSIDFVADQINLTPDQYEEIECGDVRVSLTHLNALSRFFNVRITDFFDDAKTFLQNYELYDRKNDPSPEEGLELLRHFLNIRSPKKREMLLKQARRLSEAQGTAPIQKLSGT
ncbi:MAG: helix-turn-helix transcriptional regulator [Pseudomonadota bacterium]